jgi:hypothetical protein
VKRDQIRQVRPLASEPTSQGADSPYLNAQEAAEYLRFRSVRSLYDAIEPLGIPVKHRGRTLLFHRGELDRWLAGERSSELRRQARHGSTVTPLTLAGKGDAS